MSSNIDAFEKGLRDHVDEVRVQADAIRSEMEFAGIRELVSLTPQGKTGKLRTGWRVSRGKRVTYIRNKVWYGFWVDGGTVRTRAVNMLARTAELLRARFGG